MPQETETKAENRAGSDVSEDKVANPTSGTGTETVKADPEAQDHAKITDPVEAPARNAKRSNVSSEAADTSGSTVKAMQEDEETSILSRLFEPDRKQKPALWTHIKLVAPGPANKPPPGFLKWRSKDAVAAYCLKCKKQFTYTRGTSKTISRHMMAYHGLINTDGDVAGDAPDTDGREPPLKKRKSGMMDRSETSLPILILKWLVESYRSFSIVEDPGWKQFLECAVGNSRITSLGINVTEADITTLAIEQVQAIKDFSRECLNDRFQDYSLACEVLTDANGRKYASVKIIFCTKNFKRHSMTLEVAPLDDENQRPADVVEKTLKRYLLPAEHITSIICKGVDKSAFSHLFPKETPSYGCVLVKVNQVVVDVLKKGDVGELLSEIRKSVETKYGYLKSGTMFAKVPQKALDMNTIKDIYELLLKCKSSQTPVEVEAASSKVHWIPSTEQDFSIKVLTAIMKPFYDAVITLSGEKYQTIGLSIPVFRIIGEVLGQIDVKEDFGPAKDDVVESMKKFLATLKTSFSTAFASILEENPPGMWTIPLDPRLIQMKGLSGKEKECIMNFLVNKVQECKLGSSVPKDDIPSKATTGGSPGQKSENAEKSTMGGLFWGEGEDDKEISAVYAKSSVDRYFTTVRTSGRIADPLVWWDENLSQFPEVGALAKAWLATSAIFSGSSQDKVKRMVDENIDVIVFLHENVDSIKSIRRPDVVAI